jgi:hypothetical protein
MHERLLVFLIAISIVLQLGMLIFDIIKTNTLLTILQSVDISAFTKILQTVDSIDKLSSEVYRFINSTEGTLGVLYSFINIGNSSLESIYSFINTSNRTLSDLSIEISSFINRSDILLNSIQTVPNSSSLIIPEANKSSFIIIPFRLH